MRAFEGTILFVKTYDRVLSSGEMDGLRFRMLARMRFLSAPSGNGETP